MWKVTHLLQGAIFPHPEHPVSLVFNKPVPKVTGALHYVVRAIFQDIVEAPASFSGHD